MKHMMRDCQKSRTTLVCTGPDCPICKAVQKPTLWLKIKRIFSGPFRKGSAHA